MMKAGIEILRADTPELQAKAFQIRREVFVEEQRVSREEEFDEFEGESYHFVALENDIPVGAARWRLKPDGIKLERFAVKKSHRMHGVGSGLVQAVLKHISEEINPGSLMYLHAQVSAVPLYEKFGFKKVGAMFEECNIKHYKMQRKV